MLKPLRLPNSLEYNGVDLVFGWKLYVQHIPKIVGIITQPLQLPALQSYNLLSNLYFDINSPHVCS